VGNHNKQSSNPHPPLFLFEFDFYFFIYPYHFALNIIIFTLVVHFLNFEWFFSQKENQLEAWVRIRLLFVLITHWVVIINKITHPRFFLFFGAFFFSFQKIFFGAQLLEVISASIQLL